MRKDGQRLEEMGKTRGRDGGISKKVRMRGEYLGRGNPGYLGQRYWGGEILEERDRGIGRRDRKKQGQFNVFEICLELIFKNAQWTDGGKVRNGMETKRTGRG